MAANRKSSTATTQPTMQSTWREKLHNGVAVYIRPISKEDEANERRFIEQLSPESRHYRFFFGIKTPSPQLLKLLTDVDHQHTEAFIALIDKDGEEQEIGVARYALDADGQSCECAVVVSDEWQQEDVGTLLMQHLTDVARSRGIQRMYAIEAHDNTWIRTLAKSLGFSGKTDPDDATQIIYTLNL